MTEGKSIYNMTAEELYEVYENTGTSIGMQTAMAALGKCPRLWTQGSGRPPRSGE